MIAVPAVDLRGGRCVQLVGGVPEAEAISLPDPVAAAQRWLDVGFSHLHIVDLDAALGSGDNLGVIRDVLAATNATTQVGGGIRDDGRAQAVLAAGASRIIVGTRAIDDPEWLAALAHLHPGRVTIALDTRNGRVLRKGWKEDSGLHLTDYLPTLGDLPLAGILSTDVGREGRLEGIDRDGVTRTVEASPHPMWISGGVTTEDELAFLEEIGAAGAVLGMALYTNTLDARSVAEQWGGSIEGERP